MGLGRWIETIAITTLFALPLCVTVAAILDAAHRPRWVWALSRHTQLFWLAGLLFSTLVVVGGVAAALWYAVRVRPDLIALESGDLDR